MVATTTTYHLSLYEYKKKRFQYEIYFCSVTVLQNSPGLVNTRFFDIRVLYPYCVLGTVVIKPKKWVFNKLLV